MHQPCRTAPSVPNRLEHFGEHRSAAKCGPRDAVERDFRVLFAYSRPLLLEGSAHEYSRAREHAELRTGLQQVSYDGRFLRGGTRWYPIRPRPMTKRHAPELRQHSGTSACGAVEDQQPAARALPLEEARSTFSAWSPSQTIADVVVVDADDASPRFHPCSR